jgi:hypothetical protein
MIGVELTKDFFGSFVNQDNLDKILKEKNYVVLSSLYEYACKDEDACDAENWHKDYYTKTYSKRRYIIGQLLKFSSAGKGFDMSYKLDSGLIVINDKFIVAPRAGKWRVKGKGIWYRYSKAKPSEFIKKYVLKEKE